MSDAQKRAIDPEILALDERDRERLVRLVLSLRSRGVADLTVLGAVEHVPRRLFVMAADRARALDDRPLVIECGQTATQPSVIARAVQALAVGPDHKVLEIGTGSGYGSAILARVARQVFTLDRYQTLVELAVERFAALRLDNVTAAVGDGQLGWPDHGPYDRILVNAAAPEIPPALLGQLKPEGVLVMPIGEGGAWQSLVRIRKADAGMPAEPVMEVRFAALVPGRAATL